MGILQRQTVPPPLLSGKAISRVELLFYFSLSFVQKQRTDDTCDIYRTDEQSAQHAKRVRIQFDSSFLKDVKIEQVGTEGEKKIS